MVTPLPTKKTIWQTYNGILAKMRQSGSTLVEIGNAVGVSRERIRQILNENYDEIKRTCLTEKEVVLLLGCSVSKLGRLRRQGILKPRHTSSLYLYDAEEVKKARLAMRCAFCGEPLPKYARKYCDRCSKESRRSPWKFRSEEAKQRCTNASRRWQEAHPERYKEIEGRAQQAYQDKHRKQHFANTHYVVIRGNTLPIGSIFKATGAKGWHFILEDGRRISVNNVRRLGNGNTSQRDI